MQQQGIAVRPQSIQYTGQNIGSDTEFDISVNGSKIHIGLDIEHGLTRHFDQPILMQATDGSEVKLEISATVIEERELAPDKGAKYFKPLVIPGQTRPAYRTHLPQQDPSTRDTWVEQFQSGNASTKPVSGRGGLSHRDPGLSARRRPNLRKTGYLRNHVVSYR